MFAEIENFLQQLAAFLWGGPLVILLVGGGLFFLFYSRFLPYRYLGQSVRLLFRRKDDDDRGSASFT